MLQWLLGTQAFVTEPVLNGTAPVRHVVRDMDGGWQLLCGTTSSDEAHLFHLFHALDRDQALLDVLDLDPGERADRKGPGEEWVRSASDEP